MASRPGGKHNEEVVGEAVRKVGREKVFLATKGSMNADFSPDSSDAGLRAQLASSLERLGLDSVDLYYEHRRDVKTAIEDVMRTMKALKEEGKIRFAGLSECTPAELRRAHAVFPVTAIQVEYSLQARVAVESELLAVARELGVAVVAYSPLGRGMLSGTFASRAEVPDGDWRKSSQPRWSEALAARNFEQAAKLKDIAARKACTPSGWRCVSATGAPSVFTKPAALCTTACGPVITRRITVYAKTLRSCLCPGEQTVVT